MKRDGLADPAIRLEQIELDRVTDVVTRLRPAPTTGPTEQVAEQVAEGLENGILVEVGHLHAAEAGMAIAIVQVALLGVAEDLMCLGSFLEVDGGFLVAAIAIRVEFQGQATKCLANLLRAGRAGDAQDLVVIPLGAHAFPRSPGSAARD